MAPVTRPAGWMMGGLLPTFIVIHLTHHLSTGILAPLLPAVRDSFRLTNFEVGVLVAAFSYSYAVSQVPLGPVADRTGERRVVAIGLVGVGMMAVLLGFAGHYLVFLAFLIVMGIFGGTYHAPSAALIARYFPVEVRGRVLGMHTIGGSAGFLVTPIAAGLVAALAGWQAAFVVLGIPTILAGIIFWFLTRNRPDIAAAKKKASAPPFSIRELLRSIGLVMIVVAVFQIVGQGVYTFLSTYLVDEFQLEHAFAAMVVGLMWGAGMIGAPVGGALSDRFGKKPMIVVSLVATGPLILLMTMFPWGIPFVVTMMVVGAVLTMRMPVMEALVLSAVPEHRRSSVLGVYYFFNQQTGSFAAPILGLAIDNLGMQTAFFSVGLIAFGASTVVFFIRGRL